MDRDTRKRLISHESKVSIQKQCKILGLSRTAHNYKPKGETVYRKKTLSKLGQVVYIKPYLLRGLKIDHRNQVWSIGITYIPMKRVFMYLTAIIDVYSRFIVGCSLHNTLDASNCPEVLKTAILRNGAPEIWIAIYSYMSLLQSSSKRKIKSEQN